MDHGECLLEDTLTEYLEGGLEPAVKTASEAHLVSCDHCRNRLGFYMRLLDEEITPEEANTLQEATARWDSKHNKDKSTIRHTAFSGWGLRVAAAALILLIAGTGVWVLTRNSAQPKSAGEVVHLLLSHQRPFESRLDDEPYLPLMLTRGTNDPGVAYGLLAGEMARLSADSHQMGRFYLLQKDFARALPYLETAAFQVGASAAVHNDLGVAYLEYGNASQIGKAALEFRRALELDRAFAPAIFNLAMYYERSSAVTEAAAQWNRYLEVDRNSEWGREARTRLQGLSH